MLAGPAQRETAGELATVQPERQMARLVARMSAGPSSQMITAPLPRACALMHALELTRVQGVVLDRDGQPPDGRVERRAPGTAHERSTSPNRSRRSKCSVVASCSCTTKRDAVTPRP